MLRHGVFKSYQRLTQRAPDGWESPRFQAVFWLEVGSVKMALSRPAHQRVTHTVGQVIFIAAFKGDKNE